MATRAAARRQGHARVLMGGVEMFFSHVRSCANLKLEG